MPSRGKVNATSTRLPAELVGPVVAAHPAERDAMRSILLTCPTIVAPVGTAPTFAPIAPSQPSPQPPTTRPPTPPTAPRPRPAASPTSHTASAAPPRDTPSTWTSPSPRTAQPKPARHPSRPNDRDREPLPFGAHAGASEVTPAMPVTRRYRLWGR